MTTITKESSNKSIIQALIAANCPIPHLDKMNKETLIALHAQFCVKTEAVALRNKRQQGSTIWQERIDILKEAAESGSFGDRRRLPRVSGMRYVIEISQLVELWAETGISRSSGCFKYPVDWNFSYPTIGRTLLMNSFLATLHTSKTRGNFVSLLPITIADVANLLSTNPSFAKLSDAERDGIYQACLSNLQKSLGILDHEKAKKAQKIEAEIAPKIDVSETIQAEIPTKEENAQIEAQEAPKDAILPLCDPKLAEELKFLSVEEINAKIGTWIGNRSMNDISAKMKAKIQKRLKDENSKREMIEDMKAK